MMVSNVRGSFQEFSGSFEYEKGKTGDWTVEAEIQTASVFTGDEKRDDHLRNEDFFDVTKHPTMTFKSTGVEHVDDDEYILKGDLTMLGVTKAVEFEVEFNGEVVDPWGNTRVGFEAEGEIDRKDFGMKFSSSLDNGGLVVGNTVKIELEIEGILQK
jgi:polyisoprenoid-binding protein YceI